jgi:multidrug resistance efflux pump
MEVHGFADVVDHAVAPLANGRVAKVLVHVGQVVHAGDVVAVMEARDLDIKVQSARSALAQSKAALDAADINARLAMARAELLVLKTQTSASQDQAQLVEVRTQLSRLEKLADEQLVQAQDVERAKVQEAQLAASIDSFKAANKERQAGLGRPMRQKTTDDQVMRVIEPLREAVHQKEDALKLAELALEEATVRTRVDGTVTLIVHYEGDVVPAGTEVVRVVSARPGLVIVWLPERIADKVVVGGEAELRGFGLFDRRFGGRVEELGPEIEQVPPRAQVSPNVAAWGRRALIATSPEHPLLPGEAFHVRF